MFTHTLSNPKHTDGTHNPGPPPLRPLPPAQPAGRPGAVRGGAGLAAAPAFEGGHLPPGAREQGCVRVCFGGHWNWNWIGWDGIGLIDVGELWGETPLYIHRLDALSTTQHTQHTHVRVRPREQEAGRAHRQPARVALRRGDRLFGYFFPFILCIYAC
jgi:hypothetical protein